MDRRQLADHVAARLLGDEERLRDEFDLPGRIRTCTLDGLLDEDVATGISAAFPPVTEMMHRSTIREDKFVATQMDRYAPLLEEVLFAFQEPQVVDAVARITGLADLIPDGHLYAGGISAMGKGQYLNPHIDNSHDGELTSYRVLNLLYYTTPGWQPSWGGHLQLWDQGMHGPVRTVLSSFNRLVIMATSTRSWHAVDEVTHDGVRTCVSNYYFSPRPVTNEGDPVRDDYMHVTTFRGFPGQPGRNLALLADGAARAGVRKVFRRGVRPTTQVYRRPAR